jgi:hypothetical protein
MVQIVANWFSLITQTTPACSFEQQQQPSPLAKSYALVKMKELLLAALVQGA